MKHLLARFLRRIIPTTATADGLHIQLMNDGKLNELLQGIPSETSLNERFLLYFLTKEWNPTGNILEVGPFLGGTTRALAQGVLDSVETSRKVLTIDRFDDYYSLENIENMGVAIPETLRGSKQANFRSIFDALHANKPYAHSIVTQTATIPEKPGMVLNYDFLDQYSPFSTVFVDGCKSWYSTKHFFSNIAEHCTKNAYVLFQDYGRFTCFWIPAFAESFPNSLQFVGSVDSTYIYKLVNPLLRSEIEHTFPDDPADMPAETLDKIFHDLIERANTQGDLSALVTRSIQHAAFYAYVGNKQKSKAMLETLQSRAFVRGRLARQVKEAMQSPTYTPDSKVTLE
jgi:hypothetical protein